MTNRERATAVEEDLEEGNWAQRVRRIERALDEAERRGRDTYHSELMKESAEIDRRHYIDDQREMRERAAKEAEKFGCRNAAEKVYQDCGEQVAEDIRALPIEEE